MLSTHTKKITQVLIILNLNLMDNSNKILDYLKIFENINFDKIITGVNFYYLLTAVCQLHNYLFKEQLSE